MKFKNWEISLLPPDFNQHPGIYLTASLLVVIAAVFVLNMRPVLQQPIAVTTYEECTNLPNSLIQERYPSVCVTEDGQQFIQPTPVPTVEQPIPQQSTSGADLTN